MPVTYRFAAQRSDDTAPANSHAADVPSVQTRRRTKAHLPLKVQLPQLVSIKEAAQILARSVSTVHRLKEKGDLPYFKGDSPNSPVRFDVRDLSSYLARQRVDRSLMASDLT